MNDDQHKQMSEAIKNQTPLNHVYASSDFAQGIERGKFMERERVIKLLENPKCKPNDHDYNDGCNCDVIALIKGENK